MRDPDQRAGWTEPAAGVTLTPMRRHRLHRRAAAPALAILLAVVDAARRPVSSADGPAVQGRRRDPAADHGHQAAHAQEVYGYLPYWRLDSGTVDRLHYELVSTIAFFGLGIKSNGALDTDWVGYKEYVGDDAAAVTNAAHDRGVRVVPDVPALRLGRRLPEDDQVPDEHRGPGPLHRRGARPDGGAQGGRRQPRLRAGRRAQPARQVLRRRSSSASATR